MRVFLDVSPVYWPVPSGISVQIHELARQRQWCALPITLVNFSRPRSRLQPPLRGVRWLPALHRIEDRIKVNLAGRLLRGSDGIFLATSHYVPDVSCQVWYFVYDLIRILYPSFYGSDPAAELRKLEERLGRSARVVVPSQHTAKDLHDVVGRKLPYTVLPAGVDVAWFGQADSRDASPLLPEPPYVYTNGVVQPRKRFDWSFALADHLGIPLVATGAVHPEGAEALAAIRKRYPRVEFRHLGLVSRDDQRRLYQRCSIFAFPSLYEGFGMPVLEAMAAGAIVIASNSSSIPEVLGAPEQMFDTGSLESLLERGRALFSLSPQQRASMGSRNQARARRFSIDTVARNFWRELESSQT